MFLNGVFFLDVSPSFLAQAKLMEKRILRKLTAWTAVSTSAVFANFWAYWGINENFHEGWYSVSFWGNVLMMFGQ